MPRRRVLPSLDFFSSQEHKDLQRHIMNKVARSASDVTNLAESREQALALCFSAIEALLLLFVANATSKNDTDEERIEEAFVVCQRLFENFKRILATAKDDDDA